MGITEEVLLICGIIIAVAACGTRSTNTGGSFSSSTPTPTATGSATPTPTATASFTGTNPFEVILSSQYEQGTVTNGAVTTEADCVMAPGTVSGTISACNAAIPEGRLHFSALSWTINIGPQDQSPACEIVIFQPYYYQASNAAGFLPSWVTSAVDCSTLPYSIDCFSGPALQIVPGFPQYAQVYLDTAIQTTSTYTIDSAVTKNRASNRWTVNNLAAGSRGGSIAFTDGDAYLANTFHDYVFTCNDRYMQPVYTFTQTITDIDQTSGVNVPGNSSINQFPDWDPAAWDR